MKGARPLTAADLGQVFLRVDHEGEPGKYLCLRSLGQGEFGLANFISFRLDGEKAAEVADMGYFNGPWYAPQSGFGPEFIQTLGLQYERVVAERRQALRQESDAETARQAELRKLHRKGKGWTALDTGALEKITPNRAVGFIVWLVDSTAYVVELLSLSGKVVASERLPCAQPPEFGMDLGDAKAIYGPDGLLERLGRQN